MNRRLTLRREHLTELNGTELGAVAGAASLECVYVGSFDCTGICLTGRYPSINYPCTALLTPATTIGTS